MIEIVKGLPQTSEFVAGTPKWVKLICLLVFLILAILFLFVVYENRSEFPNHWYWWVISGVGAVFLLLALKKENWSAAVNIAINEKYIYFMLPYQYKNKYLRVDKKAISRVYFSMYANKYRGISFRLNNAGLSNNDKNRFKDISSILVEKEEAMVVVTKEIGVTSKAIIIDTLKRHSIEVER